MSEHSGVLYVCPTPIGNLEDITLRALRVLNEVDIIAAEDTRVTRKLLTHYNIQTPLISYHKHTEREKSKVIINELLAGKSIALVTDSGTPLISDPGNELITAAIHNQIKVTPLPGASALTCALSASGLSENGFIFYGFLPRGEQKKKDVLNELTEKQMPVVFYESPHRVIETLKVIQDLYCNVKVFIGRELTKLHEEITFKPVDEHLKHFKDVEPRGEFTIIIDKIISSKKYYSNEELKILINEKLAQDLPISAIAKELSKEIGCSKNKIYKLTLEIAKFKETEL